MFASQTEGLNVFLVFALAWNCDFDKGAFIRRCFGPTPVLILIFSSSCRSATSGPGPKRCKGSAKVCGLRASSWLSVGLRSKAAGFRKKDRSPGFPAKKGLAASAQSASDFKSPSKSPAYREKSHQKNLQHKKLLPEAWK